MCSRLRSVANALIKCVVVVKRARALDISEDVTAELNTVRRKSREREQECLKLKDEMQVTAFLDGLDMMRMVV